MTIGIRLDTISQVKISILNHLSVECLLKQLKLMV
nr:MAG TPA: hypothetical protein [Caudoviricetes sp.]